MSLFLGFSIVDPPSSIKVLKTLTLKEEGLRIYHYEMCHEACLPIVIVIKKRHVDILKSEYNSILTYYSALPVFSQLLKTSWLTTMTMVAGKRR